MSGLSLAIVILNYNTRELLATCLRAVQKFAPKAQVIVVDNASTDGSVQLVERDFPHAQVLTHPANLGFARGINAGMRLATASLVFTLNADTVLQPTTIPPLIETLSRFLRAGIVGPVQYLPAEDQGTRRGLASAFQDPTLAREALRLLFFGDALASRIGWGPWEEMRGAPRRVDWLIGSAMLFRRECLDAVKGFDESQFMYGEDWDICYRARKAGWEVYLVPDAEIIHHENASAKQQFGHLRRARVLEANLYFHEKHFGRASRRLLSLLYVLGAGLRLILILLSGLKRQSGLQPQIHAQIQEARAALRGMRFT